MKLQLKCNTIRTDVMETAEDTNNTKNLITIALVLNAFGDFKNEPEMSTKAVVIFFCKLEFSNTL